MSVGGRPRAGILANANKVCYETIQARGGPGRAAADYDEP